jgi:hypothetical protein
MTGPPGKSIVAAADARDTVRSVGPLLAGSRIVSVTSVDWPGSRSGLAISIATGGAAEAAAWATSVCQKRSKFASAGSRNFQASSTPLTITRPVPVAICQTTG